jgi:hypothetical protein
VIHMIQLRPRTCDYLAMQVHQRDNTLPGVSALREHASNNGHIFLAELIPLHDASEEKGTEAVGW